MKQTDSMDKPLPEPLPSMKQGTFMDKHTKTFPSSMKQTDSMDKLLPEPLPSMKQGTFMDKPQDPGSIGTEQAERALWRSSRSLL